MPLHDVELVNGNEEKRNPLMLIGGAILLVGALILLLFGGVLFRTGAVKDDPVVAEQSQSAIQLPVDGRPLQVGDQP